MPEYSGLAFQTISSEQISAITKRQFTVIQLLENLMKRRRLPETDIANLAFLPEGQKRRVLESWLEPKESRGSYDPQRLTMGDAVNQQLPLVAEAQLHTPWHKLESLVRRRCRGNEKLLAMNLPVARATHAFASERNLKAYALDARPLNFPHCDPYEFASPLIVTYDEKPRLVFLDLRRTGGLSVHARRVVMSAQDVRVRERYPELRNAGLEIWRYRNTELRLIEVTSYENEPLYSYEELSLDFASTYKIMNELRAGHSDGARAANDRSAGPLFDVG